MAGAAAEGVMRPLRRVVREGEELAEVPRTPRPRSGPNDFADPAHLRTNRPKLRTSTRRSVFRDAQRAPNGEDFVCPNSGEIIPCKRDANGNALRYNDQGKLDPNGYTHPAPNPRSDSGQPDNYHFGHVPDSEYRRLVQVVEDYPNTVTNKQFRDAYNDPGHYQVEHPPTNVQHGSESTTPGYGHYSHLAPQPPTGQSP
jgi:HNH/ENDO VII superfamily nuclease with conserved GHE residues